ncbi:MAG: ABC transporter ATP-binding protein [Chloroflexi bacterium]|nr:ABC transporter ATP-binding protein [Chloroflexota bacterium]
MQPPNSLVIETHDLAKSYNGIHALRSLNLRVPKHSIFGFLGPNGAGKTTTIKLLLGLARPTAGSASILGYDVVKDSLEIRKRVGYLAQDPRYYEHMTARQILRYTAHFFFRGPQDKIEERIDETLTLVGMDDKADRLVKGFSGGERQRLGIAQAQINHPDLLILDEPAASLDPQGRHDVLEVMERLREHTTIFYSTHILSDVQRVSDMVAILQHGQLVAQASIEQLLASSGTTIYTLTLRGDASAIQTQVAAQPWVSAIQVMPGDDLTTWQVTVTDETAAEERLLRLVLADERVYVREFGRKKYDLENVFLGLTGGQGHGK